MSTSYGTVTVQFPGFKPARFTTVEHTLAVASRRDWYCGYSSVHLPERRMRFADGTHRRLSRKERSRLRTLSKKWNKQSDYDHVAHRYIRPFRTLSENSY